MMRTTVSSVAVIAQVTVVVSELKFEAAMAGYVIVAVREGPISVFERRSVGGTPKQLVLS